MSLTLYRLEGCPYCERVERSLEGNPEVAEAAIVGTLPRNNPGKLDRAALRDRKPE